MVDLCPCRGCEQNRSVTELSIQLNIHRPYTNFNRWDIARLNVYKRTPKFTHFPKPNNFETVLLLSVPRITFALCVFSEVIDWTSCLSRSIAVLKFLLTDKTKRIHQLELAARSSLHCIGIWPRIATCYVEYMSCWLYPRTLSRVVWADIWEGRSAALFIFSLSYMVRSAGFHFKTLFSSTTWHN